MKNLKKFGALMLVFVLVLSLGVTAIAAPGDPVRLGTPEQGVAGGSATFATDTPTTQEKKVEIAKELTVYNKDVTTINAPTMSYTYAITAGAADVNVTDATTDHANSTAVTVKTKAGVTPASVTLTGTSANTIAWSPAETVTAADGGAANLKYLTVDFSNVVFGAAGVYRYVLTETPANYAQAGVTETTNATNAHVRYIDVYVRPNPTSFNDGTAAADWDIYGYVCMLESEEITDAGDTDITGAVKTNGFVAGTNDGTDYAADSYYTYNVEISKTVTNDAYAAATHLFPFTVIFTNTTITQPVDIIGPAVSATVTGWTDPAVGNINGTATRGIVNIKNGASVKYVGIPNGTTVEVYETNDMAGVTYQVTTVTDGGTPGVDAAVTSTTTPTTAEQQSGRQAYQSTKTTITPTANADDEVIHTIAIDNNLQLISPTGYVARIAPFALILMFGVGLFIFAAARRRKEEEAAA